MPYTEKQKRYFHAVADGKGKKGDLKPSKAREMLAETTETQAEALSKPRKRRK